MNRSSFGRMISGMSDASAYVRFMHACWSSHRAAKVVRLGRLPLGSLTRARAVVGPNISIVYLLRHPASVLTSWKGLPQFARSREWNPVSGDSNRMLNHICALMSASIRDPGCHRLGFEDFVRDPESALRFLYQSVGLPAGIPASVHKRLDRCGRRDMDTKSVQLHRRFQVGRCIDLSKGRAQGLDIVRLVNHPPPPPCKAALEALGAASRDLNLTRLRRASILASDVRPTHTRPPSFC